MVAVTQIAHKNSDGHAYYQRKLGEGKTPAEARRAPKRKISNAIYARLVADARRAAAECYVSDPGARLSALLPDPEQDVLVPCVPEGFLSSVFRPWQITPKRIKNRTTDRYSRS